MKETRRKLRSRSLAFMFAFGIFVVSMPPAGAQTLTPLYNFCSKRVKGVCTDGADPWAGLAMDAKGNLYGSTQFGGKGKCTSGVVVGCGAVVKVTKAGKESVLYSFRGTPDGAAPLLGSLIMDAKGNLYGTTSNGGPNCVGGPFPGCGTVFEVTGKTEKVLYNFQGGTDGAFPSGGLVMDASGNLYGTTQTGGTIGIGGTVFKVDASGKETVLYRFGSKVGDGVAPYAGLTAAGNGTFYGTTFGGGTSGVYGTVFQIDTSGNESVLYSFKGGTDGFSPWAGLIMDRSGNLYGTTILGGTFGFGTVFKVDPSGNETVLHSFDGSAEGAEPRDSLVMDANGNLYGTTSTLGAGDGGTIFKLAPSGDFTVLWSFNIFSGGFSPFGGLITDRSGNFYGTTLSGGTNGMGTAFKLTP